MDMRALIPKRRTILLALVLGLVTSYLSAPVACLIGYHTGLQPGPQNLTVDLEPYGLWTFSASEDASIGVKRWRLTFISAPWRDATLPIVHSELGLPSWLWYADPGEPGRQGTGSLRTSSLNIEAGLPIRFARGSIVTRAGRTVLSTTEHFIFRFASLKLLTPLRPEPVRYTLNSLLHAGFWLLVPIARRWRRIRKNRCPACGYDQSGMPDGAACPECGRSAKGATA